MSAGCGVSGAVIAFPKRSVMSDDDIYDAITMPGLQISQGFQDMALLFRLQEAGCTDPLVFNPRLPGVSVGSFVAWREFLERRAAAFAGGAA